MEFNGKTMTVYGEFSAGSDAHAADKNNPHEVTAAQVGAAPAGYGLGESSSSSDKSWTSSGLRNGFVRNTSGSPDGETWHGIVVKEYGNITTNLAFKPNDGVWLAAMRGRTSNGDWQEWEYMNPPMLFGVEYRTTERWNGKPVYTKLVDLGEHIDFSEGNPFGEDGITVSNLAAGVDVVTDAKFRWTGSGFTYVDNNGCQIAVEDNIVGVNLNNGGENCEGATLLLKYTKI